MKWLKRFTPRTLFARALLIVVMPTVLVQVVSAYIFYDRHWENVTRHMANALAGEIAFLSYNVARMPHEDREAMQWIFEKTTNISARFTAHATLEDMPPGTADFLPFQQVLAKRIDMPFAVRRLDREGLVEVNIQLADGMLSFRTSSKRLESGTTSIFMLWMSGASLLFLCIALLFLRNQVRPIRQLAEAAESFGKGQDIPYFKPAGALEVRRAARAFLVMRERIQRQIRWRTEMLAGISHDLRTPLTRMKLQLAMSGESSELGELGQDVAQMEYMIAEYLDFAKGSGGEESQVVRLSELLASIAGDYRRAGQDVALDIAGDAEIALKPQAFRRMLQNLIDNALRYGRDCRVTLQPGKSRIEIWVDDSGPGIPPEKREEVFRAFTRLDDSRNPRTGGAGLGLTIARDLARGHGGNITLMDAPGGGLRAVVRIPR